MNMENINNTLICFSEEECPLAVTFGEHDYRHECHYGQNTIVDACTGLILEWTEDIEEGVLKKDAGTMFIVIPSGRVPEEYLAEQKKLMIDWYNDNTRD